MGRARSNRFVGSVLAGALILAPAGPALASTSLLGAGYSNWLDACSAGQPMTVAIRHADGTMTFFSLDAGQHERRWVRRGDVASWRCGGPVGPAAAFRTIMTVP